MYCKQWYFNMLKEIVDYLRHLQFKRDPNDVNVNFLLRFKAELNLLKHRCVPKMKLYFSELVNKKLVKYEPSFIKRCQLLTPIQNLVQRCQFSTV